MQNLITDKEKSVQVFQNYKYDGSTDEEHIPETVLDLVSQTAAKYETVEKTVNIDRCAERMSLKVQCYRLRDEQNFTWAFLDNMYQHVYEIVVCYPEHTRKKLAKTAAINFYLSCDQFYAKQFIRALLPVALRVPFTEWCESNTSRYFKRNKSAGPAKGAAALIFQELPYGLDSGSHSTRHGYEALSQSNLLCVLVSDKTYFSIYRKLLY